MVLASVQCLHQITTISLFSTTFLQINDIPAYNNDDVSRLLGDAHEATFRFAAVTESPPLSPHPAPASLRHGVQSFNDDYQPQPQSHSPAQQSYSPTQGGLPQDSRDILLTMRRRDPGVSLGILLREPGLTIEVVEPNSPAHHAGLFRLIGHQLTHICGRQVVTVSHVADASRGLRDVDVRLKPKICGVRLRRQIGEAWGFGVDSTTLVVADVMTNSPGMRAGLDDWMGHKITHVDGKYVTQGPELMAILRQQHLRELEVRFCPWSVEEVRTLPNSQPVVEEAEVLLDRSFKLGIGLTQGMAVNDVDPEGPCGEAQIEDYVGWRMTHIDGKPISKSADIAPLVRGRRKVALRFEEAVKGVVLSPDEIVKENVNIQQYREWLERRSVERDYAKAASPERIIYDTKTKWQSQLRASQLSPAPAQFLYTSGKIF